MLPWFLIQDLDLAFQVMEDVDHQLEEPGSHLMKGRPLSQEHLQNTAIVNPGRGTPKNNHSRGMWSSLKTTKMQAI